MVLLLLAVSIASPIAAFRINRERNTSDLLSHRQSSLAGREYQIAAESPALCRPGHREAS